MISPQQRKSDEVKVTKFELWQLRFNSLLLIILCAFYWIDKLKWP